MKLPNRQRAVVQHKKLTDYLLSTEHPSGRNKASFFLRYGFSPDSPQLFARALRQHVEEHEVTRVQEAPFGTLYTIEGPMNTPSGDVRESAQCGLLNEEATLPGLFRPTLGRRCEVMKEHDEVVLTVDISQEGLKKGDVGTIVHVHSGGEGYIVEFMTLVGKTVAVIPLESHQIRPVGPREMVHARPL